MLVTSAVTAAVVGGVAFGMGELAPTLFVGFVSVIALAHDACRFIITEGALTRLQQILGSGRLTALGSPGKQSFLTKSQQTRG